MTTVQQVKHHLAAFTFRKLFIEVLGWDLPTQDIPFVTVKDRKYDFVSIASKKGYSIYLCTLDAIPTRKEYIAIEDALKLYRERHVIIFTDMAHIEQLWLYAPQVLGENNSLRSRYIEHRYRKGQSGDALAQRVLSLEIKLADEEDLTGTDIKVMLDPLVVEKITKRFYNEFQHKHKELAAQIIGMDDTGPEQRDWYASLILNRLMFTYFIQQKDFLDGDRDYLRHHLETPADTVGSATFYRSFLLRFFHDGLGGRIDERSPAVHDLIGKVPYLNGGLFEEHQIERDHRDSLNIPDAAFTTIFNFFDKWDWHLDTRVTSNGKEINPDVLGYIFEKYINQKQMGAYYTKEDITAYISKNTIIPFLFDRARKKCQIAFDANGPIWSLLRNDPDRYIHEAVRRGATVALPPEIAVGIVDVSQRTLWNQAAPATKDDTDFALPTETWRELVARRQRYEEIKGKLSAGEVTQINDLITYNLDIIVFARDVIQSYEGVDLIKAFYQAITAITVLDPTCGSGAFLFAALNILEPLYEACLDAMQNFVLADDARLEAESGGRQRYEKTFRRWLEEASGHKNRRYFIYKSIIIRNLFGVDIMEEAVEIAKLRLFLKLVAQTDTDTDTVSTLEPLPDIDFNIRAGNTLVGYARRDDIAAAVGLDMEGVMVRIDEKAKHLSHDLDDFRDQQMIPSAKVTHDKKKLHASMAELNDELDRYLAGQYGIEPSDTTSFASWYESHKPFHWYAQFFKIMHDKSTTEQSGFDVIIGNPPYLELKEINYKIITTSSLDSNAIHGMCIEKGLSLLQNKGAISMIVPLSIVSTQRMQPIQQMIENERNTWYNNYSWRPGKLFDTVNRALTIFVATSKTLTPETYSTMYQKWGSDNRDLLMYNNSFLKVPKHREVFWIPKIGQSIEANILRKIRSVKSLLGHQILKNTEHKVFYRTTGGLYWKVFTNFAPTFSMNGIRGHSTRETALCLRSESLILPCISLFSSTTFWWWYTISSNCRDLNPYDIYNIPTPSCIFQDDRLPNIATLYLKDITDNSIMLKRIQKQTGETETQSFKISRSKPIIDEIDRVLAEHYGFTAEELDFIINYDIKYRMGREAENEE